MPGIGSVTGDRASSQAKAIWKRDAYEVADLVRAGEISANSAWPN